MFLLFLRAARGFLPALRAEFRVQSASGKLENRDQLKIGRMVSWKKPHSRTKETHHYAGCAQTLRTESAQSATLNSWRVRLSADIPFTPQQARSNALASHPPSCALCAHPRLRLGGLLRLARRLPDACPTRQRNAVAPSCLSPLYPLRLAMRQGATASNSTAQLLFLLGGVGVGRARPRRGFSWFCLS